MSRSARLIRRARLGASLVVFGACFVRCSLPAAIEPLQRFDTCDDLTLYLEDQILNPGAEATVDEFGLTGCAEAALNDISGEGEGEGARDFTTTNTQVEGVDEPDFVKNDDTYLYVIRRGTLHIFQAWPPAELTEVSGEPLRGVPFDMLVAGDRAVVFARADEFNSTVVSLLDLSDKSAPRLLRELEIQGQLVDSRRVGDEVVFATHGVLNTPFLDQGAFRDDENRQKLRVAGLQNLLPRMTDRVVGVDETARVVSAIDCQNTFAPSRSDGRNIVLLHGLSLTDEARAVRSTGVVTGFSHVYGTARSLYLASTERTDGGYFTPDVVYTRVHKLRAFEGDGVAEYEATGLFEGALKDELSLDERTDADGNDTLALVLTRNDTLNGEPTGLKTHLLVAAVNGTSLDEVARVDDIGRGEAVESVRFIGDTAYIVTFPPSDEFFFGGTSFGVPRLPFIDPLFVIDLSDRKNPVLRGELEVSGYSAYIHPFSSTPGGDNDRLLTVGVRVNETSGAFEGLNLSLFNVSDPDAPRLDHRVNIAGAGGGSEAVVDRHAITYFGGRDLLALPVLETDGDFQLSSSALQVFYVNAETGFTGLGQIEQRGLVEGEMPSCLGVRRSVMIADDTLGAFVYAVSGAGVTVARIADGLPEVVTLPFALAEPGFERCDFNGGPL